MSGEFLSMEIFSFLMHGLGVTLIIAFVSIALSFVFGMALGLMKVGGGRLARGFASLYINIVRNIPLLLFIIGFRFTLRLPAMISAIAAMTVFTTAMVAEIVRGGLNGISKGQWEASQALGMSKFQMYVYVILPQAVKKILVPLMGQFVTAIKDTSFCWIVGIEELMGAGMIIMGKFVKSSHVLGMYAFIALIYYAVNVTVNWMSRRVRF